MFIGHYAAALAAKKFSAEPEEADKRPSLGTFFFATQFLDLLWPVLLLLGIEKAEIVQNGNPFLHLNFTYYPYSHGMIGAMLWSVLFGSVYFAFKKNFRNSALLASVVFSHWILDLISHIPDLPVFGNNLKVGFGLWNSMVFTILVEGGIFIAGAIIYLKTTTGSNLKGRVIIWSLLIFLSVIYILNIISPPPPSMDAIAYAGLSQWLIIFWAYWADANRHFNSSSFVLQN